MVLINNEVVQRECEEDQNALQQSPIQRDMTVVRKDDKRQVKGVVKQLFVVRQYDKRNRRYIPVVHCRVAWEGSTLGRDRIRGGALKVTTKIKATSLAKHSTPVG